MKKRPYFRPRRQQGAKPDRQAAGSLFQPAREVVLAVLDGIEQSLAPECTPGYPLIDTSPRRCTLELSREWTWTARLLDDRATPAVGLSATFRGGETPEQRVPIDESLSANVEASVAEFIAHFRGR